MGLKIVSLRVIRSLTFNFLTQSIRDTPKLKSKQIFV